MNLALRQNGARTLRDWLSKAEAQWLHRIEEQLRSLPANESDLIAETTTYGHLFKRSSYGLPA